MRRRLLVGLLLCGTLALAVAATEWPASGPGAGALAQLTSWLRSYGGIATSDVAPTSSAVIAQSAYPQATVNTTGSNLWLSSGIGRRLITVVDYSLGVSDTITITITGLVDSSVTLTEGIEFAAETSNAQTAINIATAVNAWVPGATATASGSTVYLAKTQGTMTMEFATGDATAWTVTAGPDGQVDVVGHTEFHQTVKHDAAVVVKSSVSQAPLTIDCTSDPCTELMLGGVYVGTENLQVPVTITSIYGGVAGQVVFIGCTTGNMTISDAGNIKLNGAFVSAADKTLTLYCVDGTVWRELARSAN